MKLKSTSRLAHEKTGSRLLLVLAVASVMTADLYANTTLYWDGGTANLTTNGDGISQGGAGTWNTTLANWDQGAGLPHTNWTDATNVTAYFAGNGGAITVSTGSGVTNNYLQVVTNGCTGAYVPYSFVGNTPADAIILAGATPAVSVGSGATVSINNSIAGSGSLTVFGGGTSANQSTLILCGSNSYAGGTILTNNGVSHAWPTLYVSNSFALGSGVLTSYPVAPSSGSLYTYLEGNITVTNSLNVNWGGQSSLYYYFSQAGGSPAWNGNIAFSGNGGGDIFNFQNLTIGSPLGGGTTNTITSSCTSPMTIAFCPNNNNVIINSAISGAYAALQSALGNNGVYLNNTNNSFLAPAINVQQGSLVVPNLASNSVNCALGQGIGSSQIQIIGLGFQGLGGTLQVANGPGGVTDRIIALNGTTGGGTLDASATGLVKFTGGFTNAGGGSKTLTLQGSGTGEFAGVIRNNYTNSAFGTAVAVAGSGTWILSGANTYSGGTTVGNGTLLVNGSIGTNTVIVQSGATLGGTGSIGGNVTFASGALGLFTNGASLTISGSLTLNNNPVYLYLPANLGAGNYTLATYNTNGSSGSFASTPVVVSGSLIRGVVAVIVTSGGSVVLQIIPGTINTTTTLVASANPSVFGTPVTYTATVLTTNGVIANAAISNYVFRVDGVAVATNAVSSGQATFTTGTLSIGTHTITAAYTSDGTYQPSTNYLTQVVTPGYVNIPMTGAQGSASKATVDAGTAQTFAVPPLATNYAWRMEGTLVSSNGIVGTNGPSFTYSPSWYDVGTHYLVCYQTLPGGVITNTAWQVRVRIPLPASGGNFYVATNGSDSNPGTLGSPFLTLEAARNAVRALPRPLPAGGVTVWLRGGTYFRTNTFALTGIDSGTTANPIVYRGYSNETAVISAGTPIPASAFVPLASSQTNRLAPSINPTNILEMDIAAQGIVHATNFIAHFNQWMTLNVYGGHYYPCGGLCELFYNDQRMWLSRYPKHALTNNNLNTTFLSMDGVATSGMGSTNYLNDPGSYTNSAGVAIPVGCAFHYYTSNATEVARWQSALTNGGLWVTSDSRVPWQIDSMQVWGIDTTNQVIEITNSVSVQGGIGDDFTRPAGNYKEPWWVMNLLEEVSQPGEWAVDFNRKKIYFYAPSPVSDGSVIISDFAAPMVQLTQTTNVVFQSLTFEDGLAQGILVTNGVNNLIVGCTLKNMNNYPVDINGGYTNGVVSCLLRDLGGGGVLLHGGNASSAPQVSAGHFVVNNIITNSAVIAGIYATPVDIGGNGAGSSGTNVVGMRIAHNLLTVMPHLGILHGNAWDACVEYNDLGEFGQTFGGIGAIYGYTWFVSSGNNSFRYNFVHDSPLDDGISFDQDHRQAHVYCNVVNLNPPVIVSLHQCFGTEIGSQTTGGEQQYLDHYNNLGVNANHGFDVVAPVGSIIEENAMINCLQPYSWEQVVIGVNSNTFVASSADVLQSGPNMAYANDPGFINEANNDMRLIPSSVIYRDMPKFTQIPFEMIGLYNDETWSNATTYKPYVQNGAVTVTGPSTATISGLLAYPQFETNTTVLVYWGATDGGTNPASWQNAASFGMQGAGSLSLNLAGLAAGSTNYFRYYATNVNGTAWAPATTAFDNTWIEFGSSMLITFAGYTQNETLTNFPVLVSLSTNLPGFSYRQFASPTGGDLRFTDPSGTVLLPFEIDEWNTNGTSYVWVQTPQLSTANNSIWAYWGNPAATNLPATSTNGSVWSTNCNLVWHLKESGFPYTDSAKNHPALSGVAPASTAGIVGKGVSFSGSQYLDAGSINLGSAFTLSAWVNVTNTASGMQTVWANKTPATGNGFALYVDDVGTSDRALVFETGNGSSALAGKSQTSVVTPGQWHLVTAAANVSGGTVGLYVDGTNVTSASNILSSFNTSADVSFGRFTNANFYFNGLMDETRIEPVARGANWILASYLTVASNATFTSYSSVSRSRPFISTVMTGSGNNRNLTINWPSSGTGYALYTTTNLSVPGGWILMMNQPSLVTSNNITQWQTTIPIGTNTASYYRLMSQ